MIKRKEPILYNSFFIHEGRVFNGWQLNRVSMLVANLCCAKSTTRPNPAVCNRTLYIVKTFFYQFYIILIYDMKKSRIQETKNLSSHANSSSDTIWRGCIIYLKKKNKKNYSEFALYEEEKNPRKTRGRTRENPEKTSGKHREKSAKTLGKPPLENVQIQAEKKCLKQFRFRFDPPSP